MIKNFPLFLLATMLVFISPVLAAEKKDNASFVTEKLTVSGLVEHPLTLNVADLRQFPLQRIGEEGVVSREGKTEHTLKNVSGVRLRDILAKAKIVSHDHNDVKKIAIIVSASDGYKAVFSWNELFNSSLGDGVLVFFEENGKPLDDSEGRLALLSAKDTKTGPRYVKWLQGISVVKITE